MSELAVGRLVKEEQRKCEECGDTFIPSSNSKGRFCSRSCHSKHYHKERTESTKCLYCGVPFEFRRHEKKRNPKFCSCQCNIACQSVVKIEAVKCPICGDLFLRSKKSKQANGKIKVFCSRRCGAIHNGIARRKDPEVMRLKSNARKLAYRSKGIPMAKKKEANCLKSSFGKCRVHPDIKKMRALQRLSKRVLNGDLSKSDIKPVINCILKGETYAAYK